MAKEKTIRKRAQEKLTEEGWVVWIPSSARYGAGTTYFDDGDCKRGDDIFNIFDLVAWRDRQIKFVQYTARSSVSARVAKVLDLFEERDLKVGAADIIVEVWGYEDRKGFTRKVSLEKGLATVDL